MASSDFVSPVEDGLSSFARPCADTSMKSKIWMHSQTSQKFEPRSDGAVTGSDIGLVGEYTAGKRLTRRRAVVSASRGFCASPAAQHSVAASEVVAS